MQQWQIKYITEMEKVYCAVPTDSIEVTIISTLKRLYNGSGV
jgi:hypothetical protein